MYQARTRKQNLNQKFKKKNPYRLKKKNGKFLIVFVDIMSRVGTNEDNLVKNNLISLILFLFFSNKKKKGVTLAVDIYEQVSNIARQ